MLSNHNYSKKAQKPPALSDNPMQFKCTMDTTIRLAVQRDLVNKTGSNNAKGYGWKTIELTITELWKLITRSGNAFCTAALTNGHRHSKNFQASHFLILDIDGYDLRTAQNDPVLRLIMSFGFTTPSHLKASDKNPNAEARSKVVCLLDKPITDPDKHKRYISLLMSKLTTIQADASGKDAVRFSYGSQGGQWAFYGNVLPVALLELWDAEATEQEQKNKVMKPQKRDTTSYQDSRQNKRGTALLSELSRQIAGALGIVSYTGNQSNHVQCHCGYHKNGDANPSAVWNRDTKTLYCYTTGTTYTALETAKMLNISIKKSSTARRGLWNNTRKFLLNYSYENDKDKTKKPLTSFSRFLEAMVMYGIQPGWYTIKELDAALNGLFSDRTLRYTIAKTLISSKQYKGLKLDNTGYKGLICICVLLLDTLTLSSKVDKNANNYLTVPPPPEQSGNGRPTEYYFIPTEQELMKIFRIERGTKHDFLNIEDLQTNGTYTGAIIRVAIEQRPGQTKKTLSKAIGRTGRTIGRKVKRNPKLKARRNEKLLGIVSEKSELPIEPDYRKYIMATDTRTGELTPSPYCLSAFLYRKKFTDNVYAFQHMATTYYPAKQSPLELSFDSGEQGEQSEEKIS